MGGGGGMAMEVELTLTHGAVAAMSGGLAEGKPRVRPVLQVYCPPTPWPGADKDVLVLSDGVHLQLGTLAESAGRPLPAGTVVRVLEYGYDPVHGPSLMIVTALEILQTGGALIGSPKVYYINATQPGCGSYSDCVGSHGPFTIPRADQGILGSSVARRAECAVNNLRCGGSYAPMITHNRIDAKMQQLSLNSEQNQRLAIPSACGGFGPPRNAYDHPVQLSFQQAPPVYMSRGDITNNEAPPITPVAALNPYQASWTIKARVTAKTDVKHFNNARGPGKVFSFDLLDAQGGEIRATCFNSEANQFYDKIAIGNVYLISRGSLKPAQKKFNPLNSYYEILLNSSTSIEICSGDDSSIPRQQYNFKQISEIENLDNNAMVDLLGVVISVSPSVAVMLKNGKGTQLRTLQLKDMSGCSVEITLWGNLCDVEGLQLQSQCDSGLNPILALKGGRINEIRGRSVGATSSSQLIVNPDFPESERLRQWYVSEGNSDVWKTIAQIKDENLGRSHQPDVITVKAVVSHVNTEGFCYPACTLMFDGKQCNKKVIKTDCQTWWCNRCHRSSETCGYRYLLMCQIQDHTGTIYAVAFQEAGEEIIGLTAQELFTIKHVDKDDERMAEILQGVYWQQYLLKLKIKEETFNDGQRVRCSIVKADKLDALDNSRRLLGEIGSMLKDDSSPATEVQGATAPNYGFMARSCGSSASNPSSSRCCRCNLHGHWARTCPF